MVFGWLAHPSWVAVLLSAVRSPGSCSSSALDMSNAQLLPVPETAYWAHQRSRRAAPVQVLFSSCKHSLCNAKAWLHTPN